MVTHFLSPSTRYPSLLGGQGHCGMKILPGASTRDKQWESKSRPFDPENELHLYIQPHATSQSIFKCYIYSGLFQPIFHPVNYDATGPTFAPQLYVDSKA